MLFQYHQHDSQTTQTAAKLLKLLLQAAGIGYALKNADAVSAELVQLMQHSSDCHQSPDYCNTASQQQTFGFAMAVAAHEGCFYSHHCSDLAADNTAIDELLADNLDMA